MKPQHTQKIKPVGANIIIIVVNSIYKSSLF